MGHVMPNENEFIEKYEILNLKLLEFMYPRGCLLALQRMNELRDWADSSQGSGPSV